MLRVLSAVLVGLLAIVWSALVWSGHALVRWGLGLLPDVGWPEAHGPIARANFLAEWLPAPVVPFVQAFWDGLMPWVHSVVAWLPAALPFFTVLAWVVWVFGMLLLLGVGVLLYRALGSGLVRWGMCSDWAVAGWSRLHQLRRYR